MDYEYTQTKIVTAIETNLSINSYKEGTNNIHKLNN